MIEYLLMQQTPRGKKTILATYTAKNRAIAEDTADKFKSIKDGCRYYLKKKGYIVTGVLCSLLRKPEKKAR